MEMDYWAGLRHGMIVGAVVVFFGAFIAIHYFH